MNESIVESLDFSQVSLDHPYRRPPPQGEASLSQAGYPSLASFNESKHRVQKIPLARDFHLPQQQQNYERKVVNQGKTTVWDGHPRVSMNSLEPSIGLPIGLDDSANDPNHNDHRRDGQNPPSSQRPYESLTQSMAPMERRDIAPAQFLNDDGEMAEVSYEPQDVTGLTPFPAEVRSLTVDKKQRRSHSQGRLAVHQFTPQRKTQLLHDVDDDESLPDKEGFSSNEGSKLSWALLPDQQSSSSGTRRERGVGVIRQERSCSEPLSNFDLFQLDASKPANIIIESVRILHAEQRKGHIGIPGTRYFKIYTRFRQPSLCGDVDIADILDEKYVFRRYSDFVALHAELIDQHLDRFIPSIPAKNVRNGVSYNDSKFVIDRTKQLQTFIEEVLADRDLKRSDTVAKFLTFHERNFELLVKKMRLLQAQRVDLPKELVQQSSPPSLFSQLSGRLYSYMGTPAELVSYQLENQYQTEVVEKLYSLKMATQGVCDGMRAQGELIGNQLFDSWDKVDVQLTALQQLSTVSMKLDDLVDLENSEVSDSSALEMTQGFEKVNKGQKQIGRSRSAVKTRAQSNASVYEAQAQNAERLIRNIESAEQAVQRRNDYITKYRQLSQAKGLSKPLVKEKDKLKTEILRVTQAQIKYVAQTFQQIVSQSLSDSLMKIANSEHQTAKALHDFASQDTREALENKSFIGAAVKDNELHQSYIYDNKNI